MRIFQIMLMLFLLPGMLVAQSLDEELLAAAKKGDAAAVKTLLAKGAPVNAKTRYNQTPLMFAAERGHLEVVKQLIDAGADLNARDSFYGFFTALYGAASKGHVEVVTLLLDKGASSLDLALLTATQENHPKLVQALLKREGIKPEGLNQAYAAALEGEATEIAEMLKQAGATPPPPKSPAPEVKVDPRILQGYAGLYRSADGREYTVIFKDGQLSGWDLRQFSFVLTPIDSTSFRIGAGNAIMSFTLENEKVAGMTVKQGPSTLSYRRVEGK